MNPTLNQSSATRARQRAPATATAARRLWARGRDTMERDGWVRTVIGRKTISRRNMMNKAYGVLESGLKATGLFERGKRNALDIRVRDIDVPLPGLPDCHDGYRILHLTDLHLDAIEGLTDKLTTILSQTSADVCVMTGDYRESDDGPCDDVVPHIDAVVSSIHCRHGIHAVLGNHDTHIMVPHFEGLGVRVLVNESHTIDVHGHPLVLCGTDDVHNYFTEGATQALADAPEGTKVALVHSPEVASTAAESGFDLYLCGHTHGGQIALPGGWPVITHLHRHRALARGLWKVGRMRGYTSPGVGTSGIPVRYFTRPEVTRLTLRTLTTE